MGSREAARRIFIVLIVAALGLLFLLVRPFGEALIFATVLASSLDPLHQRLAGRLGNSPNASAGLLCAAVVLLLLLPLGGLGAFVVNELVKGVDFIVDTLRSEGMQGMIDRLPDSLQGGVERLLSEVVSDPGRLNAELQRRAGQHGSQVARFVTDALAATGEAVFQISMTMIALFFLLVDGRGLVDWVEASSPLHRGQVRELLAEFRKVTTAVLVSSVVTSGVQALAALFGYVIAGVPHPLFFALVTFFVAFVPAVGAGGVCMAAALLQWALGHPIAALFLAIWGLLAVGLVDNLVKPLLVKRGMHMHGAVVFFALIGGISAFGPVGLLLGPLIVTFLLALVRIYRRDYPSDDDSEGEVGGETDGEAAADTREAPAESESPSPG
ncbi:MAG TPA: AI-2E family transporter [Polyangiaceae bacterium]|nr:AI-2E family transporter [Polyangiaceae bacterium]